MPFGELSSSGATSALEAMVRFSAQRQRLLAHNIANISTPGFQQMDVSIADFQANLKQAIEKRRDRGGQGPFELQETTELTPNADGSFRLNPHTPSGGVMFHDRNNRSLEQLMQGLAENTTVFRVATDLLRNHNDLLKSAISQRV
jgi:flagellar basal-body rod protein FlgB